jgi:hypothetical protein
MRALLAVGAIALAGTSGGGLAATPGVTLSGTDVVTGKRFSTTAYRDKPVVVVVWSSW